MQTQAVQVSQEDTSTGSNSFLSFNLDLDNLKSTQQHLGPFTLARRDYPNPEDSQIDFLELPSSTTPTPHSEMIKIFPSTIRFDKPGPILFAPESSSSASSSTPSCYTPSSGSVSSFNWLADGLSNPDILAPTAPDLTFSFVQSTTWKPNTLLKSNNSRPATPVLKSGNQCNAPSKTNTPAKHSSSLSLDSTPTQDLKQKASFDDDDDNHHDHKNDDCDRKKEGCFSRAIQPYSSPLKRRIQTTEATSTERRAQKFQSRPASQMGISMAGSGVMMTTNSEKVKPKKSLGFLLGSGRLRGSSCLESQLQDVLSQAQHSQQSSPAFDEHAPTVAYRVSHSEPSATGQYKKTKNRISAFLSFHPAEPGAPSNPPTTTLSNQPSNSRTHRRSSVNLLDRATHSFSQASSRTFSSAAVTNDTRPSPPTGANFPEKQQPINGPSPYIKSSRSLLNLLSSKLK